MKLPSIDFETRSGTEIKLGLPAYIGDKEFTTLCLAYGDSRDDVKLWHPSGGDSLQPLHDHVASGQPVRAWNAAFEYYVWNRHCVPTFGWPALRWDQMIDTMAEAAAMNLPQALGRCAIVMGLPIDSQKDKRGKELIKLLCVPQNEPQVGPRSAYKTEGAWKGQMTRHVHWAERGGRWNNDPVLIEELHAYCKQDVVTELSIAKKLRRLSDHEQRTWVTTQVINERGVPIAVGEVKSILQVVHAERDRLQGELYTLTEGHVGSAAERDNLIDWCNGQLDEWDWLDDLQAETLEDFLLRAKKDPYMVVPDRVVRAVEIRLKAGQSSTTKFESMLKVVDYSDHRVRNMHVYHGASTGRDASRGGLNLQNLKRPEIETQEIPLAHEVLGKGDHELAHLLWGDDVMTACAACVRGVVKAPTGYEFIDADFSSVENRVGVWLAGQMDKVAMFAAGYDEYKVFSSTSLHMVPYELVTKDQRQMSKSAVLGCLFGQGARGLVAYAKKFGVLLTLERAQQIVDLYRAEYKRVKSLWYVCGDAALEAMEHPKEWVTAGAHLQVCFFNNFLWMKLPSGRLISWAGPRVEQRMTPWGQVRACVTVMQVDSKTHQWRRDVLIGSSIFQSAVQAIARDLLMNAVFNVEDAGYQVVLRVHDELLSCNPVGFGSAEEFAQLMTVQPAWAAGLPLAAEGWRGLRMRK